MTEEPLLLKDWDNWPEAVKKLIDRDGIPIPQYEQGAPVIPHDRRRKENRMGRPSKYPWDKWMDGRVHHLTHGIDFESHPRVFRNMVSQKCVGTDMRAVTNLWSKPDGTEGVDIRFESRTENAYPLVTEDPSTQAPATDGASGQEDPVD